MNTTITNNKLMPAEIGEEEKRAIARSVNHHRLVIFLRIALAAVTLVGWELAVKFELIDPFFFSQPSAIYEQLFVWVTEGTAQGPLWKELLVTMEETTLGFLIGSVMGVFFGVALGRNCLLYTSPSPRDGLLSRMPSSA